MQVSAEVRGGVGEMPANAQGRRHGGLGRWPRALPRWSRRMATEMPPAVKLEIPVIFSAMSFGSISKNDSIFCRG